LTRLSDGILMPLLFKALQQDQLSWKAFLQTLHYSSSLCGVQRG